MRAVACSRPPRGTLRLYTDPLVARMTDRSDFSVRDLRERARPMSLYLSIPFGDQERLRGWTRLVLRQLLDYAVHKKEGWPWKLLCMIDEVPGLKRLNLLTDGLNYFAGYGVRLALITPSLEELIDTYGVHHNFLEGCKIKLVFGQEDAKVAEVFSQRVGQTEVMRTRQMGRSRVREPVQRTPVVSHGADQLREGQAADYCRGAQGDCTQDALHAPRPLGGKESGMRAHGCCTRGRRAGRCPWGFRSCRPHFPNKESVCGLISHGQVRGAGRGLNGHEFHCLAGPGGGGRGRGGRGRLAGLTARLGQ